MTDLPIELLDTLYECPTDFSRWPHFLRQVADCFGSFAAVIQDANSTATNFNFFCLHGLKHDAFLTYADHLSEDPLSSLTSQLMGMAFSDHQLMPEEVFKASGMYRKVFRPNGIEYRLAAMCRNDETHVTALGVFRGVSQSPFTLAERDRFEAFTPHIRRAIRLQRQFAAVEESRWGAMEALESLPMGVIACDEQTRILFANRAARDIAGRRDGLLILHGELWANDQSDSARLRNMVADIIRETASGRPAPGGVLGLSRRESFRPLHLRVHAIGRNDAPIPVPALSHPIAVVYITDPDQIQPTRPEQLATLFGLTRREALLLHHLVHGHDLNQIAEVMAVSVHTARTFLKSILSKTGADRQSELIRLVVTSPAWLAS